MRYFWGMVATAGLAICAVGSLSLQSLVAYFVGNTSSSWAPTLIVVGFSLYGIARVWMLVMWRVGEKGHSSPYTT